MRHLNLSLNRIDFGERAYACWGEIWLNTMQLDDSYLSLASCSGLNQLVTEVGLCVRDQFKWWKFKLRATLRMNVDLSLLNG